MIFPQIVHDDGDVGIDNADFQDAAKSFIDIPDTLDHHAEILKHVLTLLVQAASCLGQLHALVVAQKKAYPQFVLQHGQLAADRRLSHMKGFGNAFCFCYGRKVF